MTDDLRRVPADVPCKKRPERMFPDTRKAEAVQAAKFVCTTGNSGKPCTFLAECRAYALKHQVLGVWGATDEDDRRALRRRGGVVAKSVGSRGVA